MQRFTSNSVLASEIASFLKKELHGKDIVIYAPCNLLTIKDNSLLAIDDITSDMLSKIKTFREILVMTKYPVKDEEITYIRTDNPILDLIKTIDEFYVVQIPPTIDVSAKVDKEAKIGSNVTIMSGCVIGSKVTIGDNCVISYNTIITGEVKIGNNCMIKPNAVIGSEIFNFVSSDDGLKQFPQIGRIILEDDVVIGSNTTIENGSLSDTTIRKGAKVDDLVNIGSDSVVGENTMVAAGAVISRNVTIANNCWLAPNVSIIDNAKIGSASTIGIGSVILHDVEPSTTVAGNPAKILSLKE